MKVITAILSRVALALALFGLGVPAAGAGSWPEWQQATDAGTVALAEDDSEKAGALFEDALAMAEAADPTDVRLAVSLDNLAEIRFLQNRDADAEGLYRRAMAFRETAFGPDDTAVAESVRRLANAEPLYLRALAIGEQSGEPDNAVAYLDSLGRFYNFIGQENDGRGLKPTTLGYVLPERH